MLRPTMRETIHDHRRVDDRAGGSPPRLRVLTNERPGPGCEYTLVPRDVSDEAVSTTWITVDEQTILHLDEWL